MAREQGRQPFLHAPQGIDGIPLVRGHHASQFKGGLRRQIAHAAEQGHGGRTGRKGSLPAEQGPARGMVGEGHMQGHQSSRIAPRYGNAGRVQTQQGGVFIHPGPGFPALFQNIHRLHLISAARTEHGNNPHNSLLGKVKRPWHKIPQALSHPHAAVKKQHGGRGSALSMARRKKDVGHQLLTV